MMTETKTLAESEIKDFFEQQYYRASSGSTIQERIGSSRCVDGRYDDPNLPLLARPGADAGTWMEAVAALRKLGVPITDAIRDVVMASILKLVGGEKNFSFHTDEHAEKAGGGVGQGCGHLRLAREHPEQYGLVRDDADYLFRNLALMKEAGARETVLKGDHREVAAIVLDSLSTSVRPSSNSGPIPQVFVFQKGLNNARLEKLSEELETALGKDGIRVAQEELFQKLDVASKAHLEQTLGVLAQGKPMFVVKGEDIPEIRQVT